MIKKIKRKFILISLLSVLFVLLFTIGAINGYNYIKMENDAQGSLTEINNNSNQMMEPLSPNQNNDRMLREHYFIVSFDSDGNVTNSDFTHIFSMRKEEGIELAKKIYASNKKKGSSN